MTTVTVAICTRNRAEHLKQTLVSLAKLRVPDHITAELLIVDNGSWDNTAEIIRQTRPHHLPTRFVCEPKMGLSHARNAALKAARGNIILFTDDDVDVPENWLESMCRPILMGKAEAVAGKVELAGHLDRSWMQEIHRAALAATDRISEENPGVMMGASMAISREVLHQVPEFDPELGAGSLGTAEESLFAWQLLAAGFQIASAFEAPVQHHFEETRLKRAAFVDAAKKLGRSYAYIHHHWEHRTEESWRRYGTFRIRLFLCRKSVQYLKWRMKNIEKWRSREGISEEEFRMLMSIHYVRAFIHERKRPRNYSCRGLVRTTGRERNFVEPPDTDRKSSVATQDWSISTFDV